MANRITRHIPNTLTCLNLFSGCIACVMAFEFKYDWALTFIIISAVFDFLDGMSAGIACPFSHWKRIGLPGRRYQFRISTFSYHILLIA